MEQLKNIVLTILIGNSRKSKMRKEMIKTIEATRQHLDQTWNKLKELEKIT